MSAKRILTIGHSNRDGEEFIALLRAHGVNEVADVRRFPGSRHNPQFGQDRLHAALGQADIGYLHFSELGGRRGRPDPDSPNTGWRVAAFQAYADRMLEPDWQHALSHLEERGRARAVAVMCAEAVPWRCHRRLIADALVVRGWEVQHILGMARAERHTLQDFARVRADGTIVYPASVERDESG